MRSDGASSGGRYSTSVAVNARLGPPLRSKCRSDVTSRESGARCRRSCRQSLPTSDCHERSRTKGDLWVKGRLVSRTSMAERAGLTLRRGRSNCARVLEDDGPAVALGLGGSGGDAGWFALTAAESGDRRRPQSGWYCLRLPRLASRSRSPFQAPASMILSARGDPAGHRQAGRPGPPKATPEASPAQRRTPGSRALPVRIHRGDAFPAPAGSFLVTTNRRVQTPVLQA
jgi:hypothetical protein